jgi:hypothetical protein
MNKYIFIIYLAFFLLLFNGCEEKKQTDPNTIKVDLNDRQEVSIFDIFSKIDIIPLETNDSSLIKTISKLIVSNDTLYIHDYNMSKVLAFNKDGNYLYQINNKGMGPGEYAGTSDIGIFNDSLSILSAVDYKLYIYDKKNGEFIRNIPLPSIKGAYKSFMDLDDETIAFWTYDYDNRLKIYSKSTGEIINEQFPEKNNIFTNIGIEVFPYNRHFLRVYDNCVFKITSNGEISEAYKWDFGKLNNTLQMIENAPSVKSQDELMKIIGRLNASEIVNYYFASGGGNSQYVYTMLNRKNKLLNIFHHKLSEKTYVFDQTLEKAKLYPLYWSDNYMIGFMPEIVSDFNEIIPDNILNEENIQIKKKLSEYDNPVLVKYHFKM